MDFIQYGGYNLASNLVLGIFALASIALAMLSIPKVNAGSRAWLGVAMVAFPAACSLTLLSLVPIDNTSRTVQLSSAASGINTNYGLELSSKELENLEYPVTKPAADFQVFGSFSSDTPTATGFARTKTFLIWRDGKMLLAASKDGESFTELSQRAATEQE